MLSTPVSLNIRLRRSWHSYQCFFTWTIHPNTTPSWHSSLAVGSLQDSTEKKCSRYPPGQIPSMGCSRTNLGVSDLASWRTQRISPWRASLEGGILWVLQLARLSLPRLDFVQHIQQLLDQIRIWGILRPGRHLEPVVTLLELYHSSLGCVTRRTVGVGHCHWGCTWSVAVSCRWCVSRVRGFSEFSCVVSMKH